MERRIFTTAQRGRLTPAEKARLAQALPRRAADAAWLAQPPAPLEVELGMGNGLALLARAQAAPERHFLGCELYQAGLATLLLHAEEQPLTNLRLYAGDARDLLAALPAGSVSRLLLPFPDPWPKARHHKRRLMGTDFVAAAQRVLAPGGELWVITDWPDYAEHTLETLRATWPGHAETEAPAWWVETKYQRKARAAGRAARFIVARH
jgi:tRNA (guanine-N7-)-methyltransferase